MMETSQNLTDISAVGNTNSTADPSITVDKRYRMMCFTLNNYTKDDITSLTSYFKGLKDTLFVFQEETGDNGTPHLQGCFKSKHQIKFSVLKGINEKIHWEKCRSWNHSVDYCSKNDTRTGQIFTNMSIKATIEDPLSGVTLHKWQANTINLMDKKPDRRSIHWFYDKIGCKGKTSLAIHLCLKYPNQVLYVTGKASDVKYGVSQFIANKDNNLKMVIFDFARSQEQFVSYQAIEEVKNGIFFNNKYESGMVVFNPPHVIVFSNFEPDKSELSMDRWKIHNI